MLNITCPNCRRSLSLSDEAVAEAVTAGGKNRYHAFPCDYCRKPVRVPMMRLRQSYAATKASVAAQAQAAEVVGTAAADGDSAAPSETESAAVDEASSE